MGNDGERCAALLSIALYLAVTVLLYLPLSGSEWASYSGGHSGLWHHCNTTEPEDSEDGSEKKRGEDCHYISVQEATGLLHVIRAFYITGFIFWGLSLIYRRLTWKARGTCADYVYASIVFGVIALISTATGVYSKYHNDDFVNNGEYSNVKYSFNFHLSIAGCICLSVIVTLAIINHCQNLEYSNYTSCSMKLKDCRCYNNICLQLCKRPSSRVGSSTTSASSSTTEMSGQTENSESNRASSRRTQISAISWVSEISDRAAVSAVRGRGHRTLFRQRTITPADAIVHPPSYDEVGRNDHGAESSNQPPSYEEATDGRELVLSPPPAYCESVS